MNIIVNGGTRGIGRETALFLAKKEDNTVLVTGRNRDALNQLGTVPAAGRIITYQLDISEFEGQATAFAKAVSSRLGTVDVLINSAGLLISKSFAGFTSEEVRKIMETNFFGPASVIRTLLPLMKKGSHIINISSMGGFQGSSKYRGLSYYSASKAALSCLSECLAEEFREEGIIVNCLALGSVQTEMFEEAFPGFKAPVKADEMAELIGEFAVKGSRFFNGKVIPVAFSNP